MTGLDLDAICADLDTRRQYIEARRQSSVTAFLTKSLIERVPALVAEVRRLTAERDAARAMADELRDDLRAADESNANLQQHIAAIRAGEF